MAGHCPSGKEDDNSGDNVTLRFAFPRGEEYTQHTSTEPDNAHRGVLKVLVGPIRSPAMFCESIHQANVRAIRRVDTYPHAPMTALSKNS